MATARISRETYERLVASYREEPGNVSRATREAKVGPRTARRAWLRGWDSPSWARAIQDVFAQEQIAARAKLEQQRAEKGARIRDQREKAFIDAAEERVREAQAVRGSLNTTLMLFSNIGIFSRVSIKMCQRAAKDLENEVDAGTITWREALRIQKDLSLTAKRTSEQMEKSMEALRKHLGEPEKILGVISDSPTTQVDASLAHDRLGPEGLQKAILDLAEGRVDSPEAQALVELQIAQAGQGGVH